jgi:hypothetical protein
LCRGIGNIGHCRIGRWNLGYSNSDVNQCNWDFYYHRDRYLFWVISALHYYLLIGVGNSEADNYNSVNRNHRMFFNQ